MLLQILLRNLRLLNLKLIPQMAEIHQSNHGKIGPKKQDRNYFKRFYLFLARTMQSSSFQSPDDDMLPGDFPTA